jgi:hypothetical protein
MMMMMMMIALIGHLAGEPQRRVVEQAFCRSNLHTVACYVAPCQMHAAVAVREEWLLQLAETHQGAADTAEFEILR